MQLQPNTYTITIHSYENDGCGPHRLKNKKKK